MKLNKPITFFEGLLVALISSFTGSVVFYAFSSVFSADMSIKLLISGLSFFYILYLLGRSQQSIGRVTVVLLWTVVSLSLWFFWPPVAIYLLVQILAIWLIRSIYFYSSLLSATADFMLTALSVTTALWATSNTGSLFLTLWCFFLTQALFVMIPGSFKTLSKNKPNPLHNDADFQRSLRVAEQAISKLSNQ